MDAIEAKAEESWLVYKRGFSNVPPAAMHRGFIIGFVRAATEFAKGEPESDLYAHECSQCGWTDKFDVSRREQQPTVSNGELSVPGYIEVRLPMRSWP